MCSLETAVIQTDLVKEVMERRLVEEKTVVVAVVAVRELGEVVGVGGMRVFECVPGLKMSTIPSRTEQRGDGIHVEARPWAVVVFEGYYFAHLCWTWLARLELTV